MYEEYLDRLKNEGIIRNRKEGTIQTYTANASQMTEAQLHTKLQRGYEDYTAGRTQNAADAFAKFTESHS